VLRNNTMYQQRIQATKVISQSTNEECSCLLAGRNKRKFQNLLAKTKKMQTQEAVTNESRIPIESYKKKTYETGQRLMMMLMLLLQMLILIESLMFNHRTLELSRPWVLY
jgi:hypothetical protein